MAGLRCARRGRSASFRLSGGECNRTFGVRRGPIEIAIGDFNVFEDDPAIVYLNIHPRQFYVVYSREDQEWTPLEALPTGNVGEGRQSRRLGRQPILAVEREDSSSDSQRPHGRVFRGHKRRRDL